MQNQVPHSKLEGQEHISQFHEPSGQGTCFWELHSILSLSRRKIFSLTEYKISSGFRFLLPASVWVEGQHEFRAGTIHRLREIMRQQRERRMLLGQDVIFGATIASCGSERIKTPKRQRQSLLIENPDPE